MRDTRRAAGVSFFSSRIQRMFRPKHALTGVLAIVLALISACGPKSPTPDPNIVLTRAVQTAFASIQETKAVPTPSPRKTAVPSATLPLTPPALPATFSTTALNPLDTPHTYIQDTCQYLKDRWTSTNAAPGTVVMVIMFHSISKDVASSPNEIGNQDFQNLMNDLHSMGFQAIHMQQLADFMYHNAMIPKRSVLLVQDDRHAAQNYTDHFQPYYKKWNWPVINGWISLNDSIGQSILPGNVALSAQGWVDYQAHGVVHNIPISDSSSDDYIHSELYGSMQAITQNFGRAPIAYIWPGGGFTPKAVQVALQAGYKLGFTVNPRGPVMFNWVPQADAIDAQRPLLIPEGPAGDPLLTLPRIWDTDARSHLDAIRSIGDAAAQYAQQNKAVELQYYNIACATQDGPIP
jgi:hypothetical protein